MAAHRIGQWRTFCRLSRPHLFVAGDKKKRKKKRYRLPCASILASFANVQLGDTRIRACRFLPDGRISLINSETDAARHAERAGLNRAVISGASAGRPMRLFQYNNIVRKHVGQTLDSQLSILICMNSSHSTLNYRRHLTPAKAQLLIIVIPRFHNPHFAMRDLCA